MITNHTVSRTLAQQLLEAGIVVESEYRWVHTKDVWGLFSELVLLQEFEIGFEDLDMGAMHNGEDFENYPAPLSSELGELLPEGYWTAKSGGTWDCGKDDPLVVGDTMP